MDDLMSWGTEKCSLLWRGCAQFVGWICINQMLKIMTFLPMGSHFTWDLFWVWGLSRSKACKCCFCFLTARAKTYIPPLLKVADHSAFCSWVIPMCLFYIHSEVFFYPNCCGFLYPRIISPHTKQFHFCLSSVYRRLHVF